MALHRKMLPTSCVSSLDQNLPISQADAEQVSQDVCLLNPLAVTIVGSLLADDMHRLQVGALQHEQPLVSRRCNGTLD